MADIGSEREQTAQAADQDHEGKSGGMGYSQNGGAGQVFAAVPERDRALDRKGIDNKRAQKDQARHNRMRFIKLLVVQREKAGQSSPS